MKKKLKTAGNLDKGYLTVLEGNKDIPFEIKRVYTIYNVPKEAVRGFHTHKKLNQFLWCPKGKIEVLYDDGDEKFTLILDKPNVGALMPRGYWHEMKWLEKDSILCVLASDHFNEDDYIRDYDEFLTYVKKGYWKNEN